MQHTTDRVGKIETNGINPIPEQQRHGGPVELFYIYFASNNGPLVFLFGAIIIGFGLNVWQAALVAGLAVVGSYLVVGVLGVAGKLSGVPMMTLSRAAFGPRGNIGPTLLSYINSTGWVAIATITAVYPLQGLLQLWFKIPPTPLWTVVCILCVATVVAFLGVYGHATLVLFQAIAVLLFGCLTVYVIVALVQQTDWAHVLKAAPASWGTVLAAFTIIFAATGTSWFNYAGDYSRYFPGQTSHAAIIRWTVLGAILPVWTLTMVGFVLSYRIAFGTAENPIQAIGSVLPSWMLAPYLILAVGGNIAGASLSIYSSGLNLLTLGVPWRRSRTVLVDWAGVVFFSCYVMLVAANFLAPFQSFLSLLAAGLTAWAAVFLVDWWQRRRYDSDALMDTGKTGSYYYWRGVNVAALVAWVAGFGIGIVCSLFTLPVVSNLGFFSGALVSAALYALLSHRYAQQGERRIADAPAEILRR
jgi:NCS1 family nucleobase:cation symporter-1